MKNNTDKNDVARLGNGNCAFDEVILVEEVTLTTLKWFQKNPSWNIYIYNVCPAW